MFTSTGNNVHQDNVLTFAPVSQQTGTNMYTYEDSSSIVESGVLASTPFGKNVSVDMRTGEAIPTHSHKVNVSNHIVLKMLFLEESEIPMR